ncbi:hypothetical protein OK016_16365 [Vibrio chagasii]|nr:hypothetical protein [Vibrio chagasii]
MVCATPIETKEQKCMPISILISGIFRYLDRFNRIFTFEWRRQLRTFGGLARGVFAWGVVESTNWCATTTLRAGNEATIGKDGYRVKVVDVSESRNLTLKTEITAIDTSNHA